MTHRTGICDEQKEFAEETGKRKGKSREFNYFGQTIYVCAFCMNYHVTTRDRGVVE